MGGKRKAAQRNGAGNEAGQQDTGEGAVQQSGSKPKPPAAGKGREGWVSEAVRTERMAVVQQMVTDGLNAAGVYRMLAELQRKEAGDRRALVAAGASQDEARETYPLIWGDTALSSRTVIDWVAKARRKIADDAAPIVLPEQRGFIFGQQFQRLNDIYQRATASGKLQTALNAVENIIKLFAFPETMQMLVQAEAQRQVVEEAKARGLSASDIRGAALDALGLSVVPYLRQLVDSPGVPKHLRTRAGDVLARISIGYVKSAEIPADNMKELPAPVFTTMDGVLPGGDEGDSVAASLAGSLPENTAGDNGGNDFHDSTAPAVTESPPFTPPEPIPMPRGRVARAPIPYIGGQ